MILSLNRAAEVILSLKSCSGSYLIAKPCSGSDLIAKPCSGSDLISKPCSGSDLLAKPCSGSDRIAEMIGVAIMLFPEQLFCHLRQENVPKAAESQDRSVICLLEVCPKAALPICYNYYTAFVRVQESWSVWANSSLVTSETNDELRLCKLLMTKSQNRQFIYLLKAYTVIATSTKIFVWIHLSRWAFREDFFLTTMACRKRRLLMRLLLFFCLTSRILVISSISKPFKILPQTPPFSTLFLSLSSPLPDLDLYDYYIPQFCLLQHCFLFRHPLWEWGYNLPDDSVRVS